MYQQTLGLFRTDDPETSRLAAESHDASGKRATHKRILAKAVIENAGLTSAEYAQLTGLDRHEAARRLADLKNDCVVIQGERRRCSVCSSVCVTWRSVK